MLANVTSIFLTNKGLKMKHKCSKFIKISEVIEKTSLSRSTIYRLLNLGDFPRQVKLSSRSIGWVEEEIQEWINEKSMRRFDTKSINSKKNFGGK